MTAERTCNLSPFLSPVVAQVATLEQAGSALEILTQTLENYMASFKSAICDDLTQIVDECCGQSNPESFLDLTDTPDTYAGSAGFGVVVNAGATGLEFSALVDSFLGLTDTPNTYAGAANFLVTVNAGETALEFTAPPTRAEDIGVERLIFLTHVMAGLAVTSTSNFLGYGGAIGLNGTISLGAIASGSVRGATPRRSIISAGGAGSTSSVKSGGTLIVLRGSVSGEGGFRFVTYAGTTTALAQQRAFIGVHSASGVIGNVNPSTLLNMFGFGYDSAQTTWQVFHNDGSGTAASTDLGANFPVNATGWFKFEIICQPAASSIEYKITNLVTGSIATGSISTDLPVNTQMLAAHVWANNGTTASAVTIEFSSLYVEMVV